MRMGTGRRWAQVVVGAIAIGGAAAVVSGWVTVGSQPFTLPMVTPPSTSQQPPIWSPPSASRVGVRVRTTGGKAVVKAGASAGSNAVIGNVPAGASAVFEGNYGFLNVETETPTGSAVGDFVKKTLGAPSDADQTIGDGSVTLPLPSGSTGFFFYGGDVARCRLATVKAGAQPVSVVDGLGNTLAALEAGDWTCCVRTVAKYGVQGAGTVPWTVADTPTGPAAFAWQHEGTATAQVDSDTDLLSLDGSIPLVVILDNTSQAGTITISCIGGTPANPPALGPGQSATVQGPLTSYAWTYSQASMSAKIKVRKQ